MTVPVSLNERLDATTRVSVLARARSAPTDADAALVIIKYRAGAGPVARFRPGELARLAGLTEDQAHDAVVELIDRGDIEPMSHPGYSILPVPEYTPPPEPAPNPPGMRAVTRRTRTGSWRTTLQPVSEPFHDPVVDGKCRDRDEGDE